MDVSEDTTTQQNRVLEEGSAQGQLTKVERGPQGLVSITHQQQGAAFRGKKGLKKAVKQRN